MKIRKFKIEDSKEVAKLIEDTFRKFNKKEGTKRGVQSYIDFYSFEKNSEEIKSNFMKSKIFYIAKEKGKIIGVIRGNSNRIINLFANSKYHGKGIGKKLLKKFEQESKKQGSKIIKVRSSPYAIPFYQSKGYLKSTGIKTNKTFEGLKFQPMIKRGDK